MMENEAIKHLKLCKTSRLFIPNNDVLEVAIKALEEIRQCREYKEIFESHFSEEALKLLSNKEEFGKWLERGRWISKKCDEINRELEQYRAIGTIGEFKALKEKSVAKKPRFYAHNYYCIECGNLVRNNEFEWQRFLYCDKCGQKLDWQ